MPNRATALRWEEPGDPDVRTRLVGAALALADESGLDAVSIRNVAARIALRPMSVYSHVASKDDLVALMFERISAELLVPEPLPGDGRELLRRIAQRAFEAYLAHPWMLHAFGRRPPPGPNQQRRAEQSAAAAAALGLDGPEGWGTVSIVHEWVMGHALHAVTLREDVALARQTRPLAPDAFERGLETVLDGIELRRPDR